MNQNYKTAFYISLIANFLLIATIVVMGVYMTLKKTADELEPVPEMVEIVPSDTDADEKFVTPSDVSATDVSSTAT